MFVEEELGEMRLVEYRVESETKIEVAGSSLLLSATRALSLDVSGCRLEQLVDVVFDKTHRAVFVLISSCVMCVHMCVCVYVCMYVCVYACMCMCVSQALNMMAVVTSDGSLHLYSGLAKVSSPNMTMLAMPSL